MVFAYSKEGIENLERRACDAERRIKELEAEGILVRDERDAARQAPRAGRARLSRRRN